MWDIKENSRFEYSFDGINFKQLGSYYKLEWGHYRGDRVGIYCYNNDIENGHVNVGWFSYDFTM